MPEQIAREMGEVDVTDADGNPHKLAEAWAERTAALVWVRHFG